MIFFPLFPFAPFASFHPFFFSPLIPFSPSILVDIILDTGISASGLAEISHFPFFCCLIPLSFCWLILFHPFHTIQHHL